MRHRVTARVVTGLALVAASLAWTAPAQADVPGFAVNLGQPATFTTGKAAKAVTAVVSTDRDGRRCRKVRWTMIIKTDGVSLDQIQVNRVENGQSFRVRAEVRDDTAQVTDEQVDPGELCRGQTVTGVWNVGFTGPDDGTVTFEVRAADATGRVLSSASTSSRVITPVAAKPSATPSKSPSASASPTPEEESTEAGAAEPTPAESTTAAALDPASGTPSVLLPGLIVGAVLVFVGVALLMRLRSRNKKQPAWASETQTLPTGFYDMPRKRSS